MSDKKKRAQLKKERAIRQLQHQQKLLEAEVSRRMARFPLEMVKDNVQDRRCDGCTACCTAVAVHELKKPMWTDCQHQCATGCTIYADRPESCQQYYCLWQAGILRHEDNRPDKLGVIFDYRCEGTQDSISAWEIWEGAADAPKVLAMINDMMTQMGNKVIICIRRYKSNARRFIGPAYLLQDLVVTEQN